MLGTFQQSCLRIEVQAAASLLQDSILRPSQFRQWLWPQQFAPEIPDPLENGFSFTSWIGPIAIQHTVDQVGPTHVRFLLSGGIDGFHDWYWGDGWVQSCLEGVTVLPLGLGHTFSLGRLRQFLASSELTKR